MDSPLRKVLESGGWIDSDCWDEYNAAVTECGRKVHRYNTTPLSSQDEMRAAFSDITGRRIDDSSIVIFPFRCDLGFNIRVGKGVIVNFDCTFLDTAMITIGDHCLIGPGCHLVTAVHPKDYLERRTGRFRGEPIAIGEDSWLGANVTVLPGVTVGKRCIIGAGSVVTKAVPDDSVYAGNPARPIGKKDE